jgi:hypothetical protein
MLVPFKNRVLNCSKPVEVYRNLNKKGKVYSVRQNNLVVGHTTQLVLKDCTFHVNLSGQYRVRTNKRKNVHAWLNGLVVDSCFGTDGSRSLPAKIKYNPYEDEWFKVCNLSNEFHIFSAMGVVVNSEGVSAAYTEAK